MTEDEYLNSIKGRTYDYPIVLRTADPLLIRVNRTSLLVNNTNFFAKIKCGLAYNGYYIYSSGLGTHIAEVDLGKESITQQIMPDGTVVNKNQAWSDSTIAGKAEEFLNHLEARIYIMPSTNAIKEAIDRFCWQMHYDVTKTARITPPEYFAENIVIDRVDPSGQIPDAQNPESQIETFKGYTMYNSIIKIASNIKDDDLDTYTLSRALREDESINNQIVTSHSIAISLREDTQSNPQSSVSQAVHDQTKLEAEQFNDISNNKLGAFGSGGEGASVYVHKTLYGAIGGYAETDDTTQTVSNGIKVVSNKIGSYSADGTGATIYQSLGKVADYTSGKTNVFGRLYGINDNVSSVSNKLGDFNPSDTVASRIGTSNDTSSNYTIFGKIAGVSGQVTTVDGKVSTINTSIGSSSDTASETSTTLFGKLNYATKKETSLSYALLGGTDYSSAPTDNVYTALLGGNNVGVIKKADGYVYANDHKDAFFYNGNTPTAVRKYYMDTEVSRFGLAYNFATQSKTTDVINAIKSQSAANPVPW